MQPNQGLEKIFRTKEKIQKLSVNFFTPFLMTLISLRHFEKNVSIHH